MSEIGRFSRHVPGGRFRPKSVALTGIGGSRKRSFVGRHASSARGGERTLPLRPVADVPPPSQSGCSAAFTSSPKPVIRADASLPVSLGHDEISGKANWEGILGKRHLFLPPYPARVHAFAALPSNWEGFRPLVRLPRHRRPRTAHGPQRSCFRPMPGTALRERPLRDALSVQAEHPGRPLLQHLACCRRSFGSNASR